LLLATVPASMGARKPTGCPWVSLKHLSEVLDQEDWGGSQW